MFRLRVLPLLSVVVFASCIEPDSALRVDVVVKSVDGARVRADCLRVQVLDSENEVLDQSVFTRPADDTAVVAIRRGDRFPQSVGLRVQGLQGSCDDESTLKLNAQSDVLKAEFPERGFSTVTIELGPPNPALDADRDGWVDSKKGGPDCNDDDRTIFPGGKQACMSSQDTDCDGFLYCDDTDCSAGMLCADPPTRVVIKTAPSPVDMPRHSCNGPFIAELRNAAGPRNAVRNTPITITSSQPGLTFHTSCTSADNTFTIPYDSSEVQFFAKADGVARGPVNVTVAAERVPTAAELQIKVSALPVASIVITSSPDAGVIAGDCMAQTIDFELLDSMNRHTDADDDAIVFNLTAKLGAAPISDFLYSDAACGSAAPTLNFPPGVGNASIRAKSERAGVYDVAAVRGALSAGQAVNVTPAAPSKLQLLNSFLVLSPQVCSNDGFGVTLLDRFNNPVPAPAGTTLTVGTESMIEGVTFHGNVDCLPPATDTVDFPTGQTERRIPTRGTLSRTGRARVSTNLAGVAPTDWLNISVGVGALASLDFGGTGQTIVAAGCSPMPMRFVARDNSGNPTLVPDGGVTIAVTASNPGSDLRFFTSANCTPANGRPDVFIPGGAPALDVYFSGTRARPSFSFSGTNPNYPVDGGVSGNVIYAAPPTRMTLTPDAGTVSAPGCIPFTASLFDSYDNPATFDGGRGFMLTPPAVVVSPTGACAGGGISVPGSQTTFDFFAGSTVAGTYPMTAQTGGLAANAFLAVTPAAPQLSASPTVVSARAGDCVPVTLDRRDMFNNATPVTTNTTFPVTAGARTYVFSQPGCTGAVDAGAVMNANTSTTTFSLRPIEAVSQTVTIDALGGTNPTVALTVTPNDTFRFEFNDAGSPLTLVAGQCSPELRVTRYDVHGNLVTQGNQTAGLTSMNLARFTNSASCATNATITEILIADGQSTSGPFYVTGTLADAGVLRADLGVINGTRAVQVSPAGADHLSFASMAGTAQAGICAGSDLRVELRDPYENRVTPAGPVTVTLTSDGGVGEGGNPVFFSGSACTAGTTTVQLDGANPTATFRFLSTLARPANDPLQVIASVSAPVTSSASQNWVVTPRAASALRWKENLTTVNRFGCSRLGVVEPRDTYGNVAPPASALPLQTPQSDLALGAQFFTDSSCTSAMANSIPAGASESQLPYFVVANGVGPGNVRAVSGAILSPQLALTVNGNQGSLTASDAGFVEAAACRQLVVTRLDHAGQPVTKGETPFTVTSSNAAISVHSTVDCSGDGGVVSSSFTAGQSTASVWLRGRSSDGALQVPIAIGDVNGGSTGTSTEVTSLPLVRRGACNIADNAATMRCELTPAIPGNDLSRSFLLFSSTGGDATASLSNVACRLDPSPNAAVVCTRAGDGSVPAGDQSLAIEYQVVSYGRGLDAGGVSVQHLPSGTTGTTGTFDVTLPSTPMGESFVLFSTYGTGGENGSDDFPTMHLENSTTLRVLGGPSKNYEAQVVSVSGAQVTRGETTLEAGAFFTQAPGIPAGDVSRAFLLYSVRGADRPDGGVQEMCKRQVRGGFDGGAVYFARGYNAAVDCGVDPVQIRWEAVRLPAASSQQSVVGVGGNNSGGTRSSTFNFASVVQNRSVGFVGGQGPGGQSMGESNFFDTAGANGDTTGPFRSVFRFNSATQGLLECRNPGQNRDSQFNPFVVQFAP